MGSRRRFAFGRSLTGLTLLCAVSIAGSAGAQTDDQRAGARAAATAGGQAYMERRYPEAVDLFTRAESLLHSPVHLLYMARSYEKLGSLVRARETYIRITNEELAAGAPAPVREAKADAEKELEALEPRIPYVSVVVQGAGPKPVTVTMDGVQVPPALLGVPRPVDPGEHKFQAVAEGMESAQSSIQVREKRSETVVLTLNAAAPGTAPVVPAAVPGTPPPAQPGAVPPPPPPGPEPAPGADSGGGGGPSPFTWVAFGVGAVGLGVGTVFALGAKSAADDANDLCKGASGSQNVCDDDDEKKVKELDDDHQSKKTLAIVGFAAGGVGIATGVALLVLTSPKKESAAAIQPWVGLGSVGVNGRF